MLLTKPIYKLVKYKIAKKEVYVTLIPCNVIIVYNCRVTLVMLKQAAILIRVMSQVIKSNTMKKRTSPSTKQKTIMNRWEKLFYLMCFILFVCSLKHQRSLCIKPFTLLNIVWVPYLTLHLIFVFGLLALHMLVSDYIRVLAMDMNLTLIYICLFRAFWSSLDYGSKTWCEPWVHSAVCSFCFLGRYTIVCL